MEDVLIILVCLIWDRWFSEEADAGEHVAHRRGNGCDSESSPVIVSEAGVVRLTRLQLQSSVECVV